MPQGTTVTGRTNDERRRRCCLPLLAATILLGASQRPTARIERDAFDAALEEYRGGRYEAALAAFDALEAGLEGAETPPQLRLDAALCELRLLRSRDAELRIAPLVDDDEWADEAAFLLGMAAHQHAERAVGAALLPDAEPMAWAMATRAIQRAELQFRRALQHRPDWPEAVRNLERVVTRRAEIEALRDAAEPPDTKKEQAPEPEPPQPQPDEQQPPEVVLPELATRELTADELRALQERVRARQDEKLRGRQRQRGTGGGRGW